MKNAITKSSNMVSISSIILTDVWADYSVKFAEEFRPFIRKNESQENWIQSVNLTQGIQIAEKRKQLFSIIPLRFHNTEMYKDLKNRLFN